VPNAQDQATKTGLNNWMAENVDQAINGLSGVYENLFLRTPSLFGKTEHWVWGLWGFCFALGLLLVSTAFLIHAYHLMKGESRTEHLKRLAVPLISLGLMVVAPFLAEGVRAGQEWIWAADSLQRDNAAAVLRVVLPQSAKPEPPSFLEKLDQRLGDALPTSVKVVTGIVTAPARAVYGLVVGVSSRVGTPWASALGFLVLVLGQVALLIYFVRGILVGVTGIYLGLTAFADDWRPAVGWADLLLRTILITNLFNLAWDAMRMLPEWFGWMNIDSFWFVVLIIPITIALIWRLWVRRLFDVVTDLGLLGGTEIVTGWAKGVSFLGQIATAAGTVTGQPAIAGAGAAMQQWGNRTAESNATAATNVRQNLWWNRPQDPGSPRISSTESLLRSGWQAKVRPLLKPADPPGNPPKPPPTQETATEPPASAPPLVSPEEPAAPAAEATLRPCWVAGAEFVIEAGGISVYVPSQPPGTVIVGQWPGHGEAP
jgi:hypothetical protein